MRWNLWNLLVALKARLKAAKRHPGKSSRRWAYLELEILEKRELFRSISIR